ncbi:MAG: ABC transporter ATP-binding protein [Proteobacteria bacterium]|nr:ABC transporter ATP-binding protein [Pseudomonadota bacterium]MCP4921594.1 ABC transporter ATP-binding protein [Pseudomonadota bacterium]
MADLLLLDDLHIEAELPGGGRRELVRGVGLHLDRGSITVLVGASGSGKTLTARTLVGMCSVKPGVTAGTLEIVVDGTRHRPLETGFTGLRGAVVGYLPQDARGSLDPLWRIGRQVNEALELAGRPLEPAVWLKKSGLADGERVAELYPHELSGGMAQRVAIALALARGSRFLVVDEPTTGLDPTVQEAILDELLALKREGVGILFITHDLRLVPKLGDHLLVMHQGRIVEDLPTSQLSRMESPEALALWQATARIAGGAL